MFIEYSRKKCTVLTIITLICLKESLNNNISVLQAGADDGLM